MNMNMSSNPVCGTTVIMAVGLGTRMGSFFMWGIIGTIAPLSLSFPFLVSVPRFVSTEILIVDSTMKMPEMNALPMLSKFATSVRNFDLVSDGKSSAIKARPVDSWTGIV